LTAEIKYYIRFSSISEEANIFYISPINFVNVITSQQQYLRYRMGMLAKKQKKWITRKRRRSSLIEKPSISGKILLQDINCVGKHPVAKMAFNSVLFSFLPSFIDYDVERNYNFNFPKIYMLFKILFLKNYNIKRN